MNISPINTGKLKVFLLPGLGFDCRIFKKLDFEDFDVEHLNWIEPLFEERFRDYSVRLFENKVVKGEKVTLIGYSFGGMAAQEIAAFYKIDKIILISSIKSGKENPFHFRIVKPLMLYKLFTKELCLKTIKYWGNTKRNKTHEEHELFKSMLLRQSNTYLRWALKELSIWKSPTKEVSARIFQIHGDKDKTFPIKLVYQPNEIIKNGCHLMVFNRSEEISEIVLRELKSMQQ